MSIDPTASWITGLMRENYEAIGFIPDTAVQTQYVTPERFVLQSDERGRRVGYLLHGVPRYGRSLSIAQHCIQYDRRNRGYGEAALDALIEKARQAECSLITARCAVELESLTFWRGQGFQLREVIAGGQRRNRLIARLALPLHAPLWDDLDAGERLS